MRNLAGLRRDLRKLSSPRKAKTLQKFFKTGKGEYGEGDVFLGVTVPDSRKVAKKYEGLPLESVKKLLDSKVHEERLVAVLLLVRKCQASKDERIVDYYLRHAKKINSWDLVDLSAPKILGEFLKDKEDRSVLYRLAKSKNVWERRIGIVSTYALIRDGQIGDALKISEILLKDGHDLIHKAVGWMLREVGKRDLKSLEKFLMKRHKRMPRVMLRYAVERVPERKRRRYMTR